MHLVPAASTTAADTGAGEAPATAVEYLLLLLAADNGEALLLPCAPLRHRSRHRGRPPADLCHVGHHGYISRGRGGRRDQAPGSSVAQWVAQPDLGRQIGNRAPSYSLS